MRVVVGILATGVCIVVTWIWYCNREPAWGIHPSVDVNNGVVTVSNRNDFDWRQVYVTINASTVEPSVNVNGKVQMVYYNGYLAHIDVVKKHTALTLPAGSFADNRGDRWNSIVVKPLTVEIDCADSAGQGIQSWQGHF
jgi:hypothetical protein